MPTSANWTFIALSTASMCGRPRALSTIRGRRLWRAPAKRTCRPGQGVGQPGLAGRRRPVGVLDLQVDFFAMDRDVAGRADAAPYVAPADIEHDQLDVRADAQIGRASCRERVWGVGVAGLCEGTG